MRTRNLYGLGALSLAVFTFSSMAYSAPVTSPANVRSGPGSGWPVIAAIPAGTDVTVVNCGEGWRHSWCQIEYGSVKGYVNGAVLAAAGQNVVVAPVVTTDAVNLRASANLFSPVIDVIPGGEPVNVLHCRSGWGRGWCHVAYEEKTGYVRGGLLERQGAVIPQ